MRSSFTFILNLGFLWIILSCSKPALEEEELRTAESGYKHSALELELFEEINSYRLENGLPTLLLREEISVQAEDHNEHMIVQNEVCHHFFGSRFTSLKANTGARAASENVAFGYREPRAVVKAWAKSMGHRKNMEGDFSHVGLSIGENKNKKRYYTTIFIRH